MSRPRRILVGLKSDTPSILLGAERSFKAPTIAEAKAFRLACDRRATVLKLCPLAASMLAMGMVDVNIYRLPTCKDVIDQVSFVLPT
jgi:hypothetical protein